MWPAARGEEWIGLLIGLNDKESLNRLPCMFWLLCAAWPPELDGTAWLERPAPAYDGMFGRGTGVVFFGASVARSALIALLFFSFLILPLVFGSSVVWAWGAEEDDARWKDGGSGMADSFLTAEEVGSAGLDTGVGCEAESALVFEALEDDGVEAGGAWDEDTRPMLGTTGGAMGVTLPAVVVWVSDFAFGVGWVSTRAFLDFLESVPGVAATSVAASSFLFFSAVVSLFFLAGVFWDEGSVGASVMSTSSSDASVPMLPEDPFATPMGWNRAFKPFGWGRGGRAVEV